MHLCFIQPSATFPLSSTKFSTCSCPRPSSSLSVSTFIHSPSHLHYNQHVKITTHLPEQHPIHLPVRMGGDKNVGTRVFAGVLMAGLVISSFLPLSDAIKSAFTDTSNVLIDKKLSSVPVFTVTDSTGRPYLTETSDGKARLGYFFIQPSDAQQFLDKVRSTPTSSSLSSSVNENFNMEDAKLLAVGMNDIISYIDGPGSSVGPVKSVPERFQLFPDDHEYEIAQTLSEGNFRKVYGKSGVPVFYVEGLAFKDEKTDGKIIPVFFEKEKLDEALANLKKSDPTFVFKESDLQIMDFLQTVREIRAGADARLNRIIFIPLTDAMSTLNKMNENKPQPS